MSKKSTVKRWVKAEKPKVKKPAVGKKRKKSEQPNGAGIYQLKITLLGFKPVIWRRIVVEDCTLDKLHEHVQTAMGWTNSHLHQFRVGKQLYGDPELMQENFEEFDFRDSTTTKLSRILPADGKRFSFFYEYDFGDSWEHEIRFEKVVDAAPGESYPRCTQGERACPPEDCGGVWGYADLLDAIGDKHHEQHEELLEWLGESFDPEAFDAKAATNEMQRGLPAWR